MVRPSNDAGAVLVVVPTLNEARHIERVLAQLCCEPESVVQRIVVADGGSTDGTRERVLELARRDARICLLHNPRRLQSAGINAAVAEFGAAASVLIRCDAHATYPERYCSRLIATLAETGADSVVVVMDTEAETPLQHAIAWVSNSVIGNGGSAHRGGRKSGFIDHGHHAAFRLDTFQRVGGYDASFSHNEDAEYDCRQRSMGARVYLDAELRIGYLPRRTLAELGKQYYRYGKGRARTAIRHPGSLRPRQLALPLNTVGCALATVAAPLAPWLLLWPAAYLGGLTLTSAYFAVAKRSPVGLLTGPAALVMHGAWSWGFLRGLLAHRNDAKPDLMPLAIAGAREVSP